jgi:16S rRNA (uracil1498-N3)-methyltransferase
MAGFYAFYPQAPRTPGASFELPADQAHHLVKVLRACQGQSLKVLRGDGTWAISTLTTVHKSPKACTVCACVQGNGQTAPAAFAVTLALGLPQPKALEALVRTGSELGLCGLVPLITRYSDPHYTHAAWDGQRLLTLAIEGCKQSGNPWLMTLEKPKKWVDWLDKLPILGSYEKESEGPTRLAPQRWVASLQGGTQPLLQALAQALGSPDGSVSAQSLLSAFSQGWPASAQAHSQASSCPQPLCRVLLLVGPEGDFSPQEYAAAQQAGFLPISLGSHVLRTPTAVLAALSIIQAAGAALLGQSPCHSF